MGVCGGISLHTSKNIYKMSSGILESTGIVPEAGFRAVACLKKRPVDCETSFANSKGHHKLLASFSIALKKANLLF